MARKKTEARREEPSPTALSRARAALERGNVRLARRLLQEATGPEAEEARRLLERMEPDRTALLAVAGVILLILVAAWRALGTP